MSQEAVPRCLCMPLVGAVLSAVGQQAKSPGAPVKQVEAHLVLTDLSVLSAGPLNPLQCLGDAVVLAFNANAKSGRVDKGAAGSGAGKQQVKVLAILDH